ncbi:Mitochondrial import inner membrane translocase subunit Tim13, partial [Intoshia linei]
MYNYDDSSNSNAKIDNEKLLEQAKREIAILNAQDLIKKISDKCFTQCITKPSQSVDSYQMKCLNNCVDRYNEVFDKVDYQRSKNRKFKEIYELQEEKLKRYGNIMYDRRIVRGNTYGQNILPIDAQIDPIELQRKNAAARRALTRKRAREQLRKRTPEPVEGRENMEVQTELYLEEISDKTEEVDTFCQTDAFLDRPPSPCYVPAKIGEDRSTQIWPNELFDFDLEVTPILQVLVGKTVEQSLLEVMEEEELENLRIEQRKFQVLRNAEIVEQQRLAEQDRRHQEEKKRRIEQQQHVIEMEKENIEKINSVYFAKSYLMDLIPVVFSTLQDQGYFYDPIERDIETNFIPWLIQESNIQQKRYKIGSLMLDHLIKTVVK